MAQDWSMKPMHRLLVTSSAYRMQSTPEAADHNAAIVSLDDMLHARNADDAIEAVRLGHRLIADELKNIGIDGDFAPVLDVPVGGADPIIGDRAFSHDPRIIPTLARAALNGLHAGGVAGCIKHMPGHGRAEADSHLALPKVRASEADLERDVYPFAQMADAETAMTAHIVYEAWDPDRPATCSPTASVGSEAGDPVRSADRAAGDHDSDDVRPASGADRRSSLVSRISPGEGANLAVATSWAVA
jgi:hypothetical protein